MAESMNVTDENSLWDFFARRGVAGKRGRMRPVTLLHMLGEPRPIPFDLAMKWISVPALVRKSSGMTRNPALPRLFWESKLAFDCRIISLALRRRKDAAEAGFFPDGFGFDRFPDAVLEGVASMVERRRLAGISPFLCGGLPYGHWDDCFAPSGIAPMSWRMNRCLMFLMIARDVARVRSGLDAEPAQWPSIHRQAMAIMDAARGTVAAAESEAKVLRASGDPFFGPGDPQARWRDVRTLVGPFRDDSWVARYGTLCA